jgi:putative PIG3 family NAD(P)H quinone oxidoreductase
MLLETMNAVLITRAGGPEVLRPDTRPVPQPEAGQVLIKVAFAGVNRADCDQRIRGSAPAAGTDIPGLEVAGEIVATGPGVSRWKVGDRVCALVNGGGYAQYCIASEAITLPIPAGFDLKQAAALPETLLTAWSNLFMTGRLKPGEWLLVHGGSSGVGTMAIQLARLEGARVIATAGSAAKCDVCVKLGAASAINYREQDFVAAVQRITDGHGADVILDMVQGRYARKNLEALATDGRIVHLNPGPNYESEFCAPLGLILTKRAIVTGSRLRISPLSRKVEIVRQVMDRVWPHLGKKVMPVIDSVIPLEQASAAHARMESSAQIGKILLEVAH